MSMPVTTFYCTSCDFRQGDVETWGSRVYVTPDNRTVQVPRRLGWCEDCGGLASVETFSEAEIRKEIRDIEEELQAMPSEPSRQPWEVFKYLPFSGWETKVQRWHYKQDQLVGKLDETTTLLAIIKQRKSPPRCLECGSSRVRAPLVQDKSFWDSPKPVATGFIHPGCGGELWADEDGMRISLRPSTRYYSGDGEFIERLFNDD